jgi:hypothetical protein
MTSGELNLLIKTMSVLIIDKNYMKALHAMFSGTQEVFIPDKTSF